jgi:two-component system sensor histidine kinase MprB
VTLRVRLALALAVLAALSVVVVAAVSYVVTDHRLHDDIDAELMSYASRFTDPDGRSAHMLCSGLTGNGAGTFQGGAPPLGEFGGPLGGVPNGAIQCVDASGTVTGWSGSVNLPVTGRIATAPPPSTGGAPQHPAPATTEVTGGRSYRIVIVPVPGGGEIRIARSLVDTDRALRDIRDLAFGVGIAVIALAALAGWVIASRTARPVHRLTEAAEAVAATGQFEIAVPPGGKDEVGRLTRAFRSMLDALNRSRAQQQRLVQDAGHELRTPLTSLRANIDTLRRHPELADEPREHLLTDLDSEMRELSGLVDELVALAVDRYDNEPEQRVRLDEVTERVAGRSARRSGREIIVDAEPAEVLGRPGQLQRAVANLLDNATKFSPDGTRVEVTVRPGRVEVRDHGPGIPDGDLEHVFDRFYRAVDVRSLPGSGLGLSIVREAVETAGGHVQAANHPDGGAVLTIEFPAPPGE